MDFVNLHVHSDFSFSDGAQTVDELCNRVVELKQHAVALTDHGTVGGVHRFIKTCTSRGIKPLVGCELYMDPREALFQKRPDSGQKRSHHLTVLAKNRDGYNALCKVLSDAHHHNFRYHPLVTWQALLPHAPNLIILTGCLAGELAHIEEPELLNYGKWLRQCFTVYGELQYNNIDAQRTLNQRAKWIAEKAGFKTVRTADCHYSCPEHRKRWKTINSFDYEDDGSDFSLCSAHDPVTCEIADQIETFSLSSKPVLPVVPEAHSVFEKLCWDNLSTLGLSHKPTYRQRLSYEIAVIQQMEFESYFLVLQDVINWCQHQKILVGPGRGSAAGSLVCFALGITQIDPVRYGLLFERFLNPERVSLPDIDVDFQASRRHEVFAYIKEKHGNVFGLSNYTKIKARSALKDAMRSMGYEPEAADEASKLLPKPKFGFSYSLADSYDLVPAFRAWANEHPEVFATAQDIEGIQRGRNVHPSGVVLSNDDIHKITAHYAQKDSPISVLEIDMRDAEEVGLVKFDFLGLRALDVINEVCCAVGLRNIPEDDNDAFDPICNGDTFGVFQLENSDLASYCKQAQPRSIEELSNLVALYRPGPIESGMLAAYFSGKDNTASAVPELEQILKPTRGVVIYQEQVMQIVQQYAGYTMAQADAVRKVMGKKLRDQVEKAGAEFFAKATALAKDPATTQRLWNSLAHFAAYGFNKSHSVAYSTVSYQTAYLKHYFPAHFYAAVINSYISKRDRLAKAVIAAINAGLRVERPSLDGCTKSLCSVTQEGAIRLGWATMNGVSEKAGIVLQDIPANAKLLLLRKNKVVDLRVLRAMCKGMEWMSGKISRSTAIATLEAKTKKAQAEIKPLRDPLFAFDVEIFGCVLDIEALYQSLVEARIKFKGGSLSSGAEVSFAVLCGVDRKNTRTGQLFAILTFQDDSGVQELPMWPDVFSVYHNDLYCGDVYLLIRSQENAVQRLIRIPQEQI